MHWCPHLRPVSPSTGHCGPHLGPHLLLCFPLEGKHPLPVCQAPGERWPWWAAWEPCVMEVSTVSLFLHCQDPHSLVWVPPPLAGAWQPLS